MVQTATNPQTGETIALVNGQWVPLPTGGLSFERLRGTHPAVTPLDDPTIVAPAEDVGLGGQFVRSMVNAAGPDTIAGIGGALQSFGLEEWGQGLRDFGEENALPPAGVRSIDEINSVWDVPSYVANMGGMALGSTIPVAGTAAVGALAGSAVPVVGTIAGGIGGAALGSYGINEGQTYIQIRDALIAAGSTKEDAHDVAAPIAMGLGVPIAALDTYSLGMASTLLRGPAKELVQQALEEAAKRGLIGTAVREVPRSLLREAGTETGQTVIQEMGEASVNPQYDWSQLGTRMVDSAVAGALGGAAFGVAGAPAVRGQARTELARRETVAEIAQARADALAARDAQERVIDQIAGQQLLLPPPEMTPEQRRRETILAPSRTAVTAAQDRVTEAEARLAAHPGPVNEKRLENVRRWYDEAVATHERLSGTDIFAAGEVEPHRVVPPVPVTGAPAAAPAAEPVAAPPSPSSELLRIRLDSIDRAIKATRAELKQQPTSAPALAKLNHYERAREQAVAALGPDPAGQLAGKVSPIRQPAPDTDINALARETAKKIVGDANHWVPIQEAKGAPITGYVNYRTGEMRTPEQHLAPIPTPLSGRDPTVTTPEDAKARATAQKEAAAAAEKALQDQRDQQAAIEARQKEAAKAAQESVAARARGEEAGQQDAQAAAEQKITAPEAMPPADAPISADPVDGQIANVGSLAYQQGKRAWRTFEQPPSNLSGDQLSEWSRGKDDAAREWEDRVLDRAKTIPPAEWTPTEKVALIARLRRQGVPDLEAYAKANLYGGSSDPFIDDVGPDPADVIYDMQKATANQDAVPAPQGATETVAPSRLPSARVIGPGTTIVPGQPDVPVEYAVVEADDVVASQNDDMNPNPAYLPDLQPRDRTRAAAEQQVNKYANTLDPRLLDRSPRWNDGAPIVGPDGMVDSGNGRTLAIKRAYDRNLPTAQAYRDYLAQQGYPVQDMRKPMLVRIDRSGADITTRVRRNDVGNKGTGLAMSATEKAMSDARLMGQELFSLYRGGDFDSAANRPLVRKFMERVMTTEEAGNAMTSDGMVNQSAVRQIQNAVLARAYGDSALLEKLVESTDNNIKAIGGALLDVAPTWVQMRDAIEAGRVSASLDMTAPLIDAAKLVSRARSEGLLLGDMVTQQDAFTGRSISIDGEAILKLMYRDDALTRPLGRDRLAEQMQRLAEKVLRTGDGADMFGATPSRSDLIRNQTEGARREADPQDQPDLLATPKPGGVPGRVREGRGDASAGDGAPVSARPGGKDGGSRQPLTDQPGTVAPDEPTPARRPDTRTAAAIRQAGRPVASPRAVGRQYQDVAVLPDGTIVTTPVLDDEDAMNAVTRDGVALVTVPAGEDAVFGTVMTGKPETVTPEQRQAIDAIRRENARLPFDIWEGGKPVGRSNVGPQERASRARQDQPQNYAADFWPNVFRGFSREELAEVRDTLERANATFDDIRSGLTEKIEQTHGPEVLGFVRKLADGGKAPILARINDMLGESPATPATTESVASPAPAKGPKAAAEARAAAKAAAAETPAKPAAAPEPKERATGPAVPQTLADAGKMWSIEIKGRDGVVVRVRRVGTYEDKNIPERDQPTGLDALRGPGWDKDGAHRSREAFVDYRVSINGRLAGTFLTKVDAVEFAKRLAETPPAPAVIKAMRPDEPGAEPTPQSHEARIAKAETDIRAMLKRMTGKDVDFTIVDKPLTIEGETAVGGFNSQTHAIVVSAFDDGGHAYTTEQITGFARHEAIHWMRENGLFSPDVWTSLERQTPKWRKQFKIDQHWAGQPEEILKEEAIAEAYRQWAAGKLKVRGPISQAFAMIQQMLRAIRRALGMQGFQNPEQIFRGVEQGQYALDPAASPATLGRDSGMLALSIGPSMDNPLEMDIAASWDAALARNYWVLNLAGDSTKAQAIGAILDRSRELIQDRYLPLRRLQEAIERIIGRPLSDSENAYLAEELMHSKIGDAMLAKDRDIYQPILESMKQIDRVAGGREQALLDVDRYLVARHAPERNAQIARINKDKDGNAKLDGSGITDAEAAKRVADLEAKYGQPLKDIQAKVVDMLNRRMELEVANGLRSREEADKLLKMYPNFVRLTGNEDPDAEGGTRRSERSGRGLMGKRGPTSRRATGRYTEAVDVLAHSLSYFDQTVVRANQNVVRQALLNLAAASPDPDVWTIDKAETRAQINKSTGMVQYVRQAEAGPNVVFAHVDGQEFRIALNDETEIGQTMIRSLAHLEGREVNRLLGTMMKLNILLSKLNTTLNPEFLLTNWIKDVQTAGINLQQFGVDRLARNSAKHLTGALKASYSYQRRKPLDTEWKKWAEKFAQSGGMTYFNDFREPGDYIKDINAKLKAGNGGNAQAMWGGISRAFRWIDQTNNAVDMATRLSVYRAMVESGLSENKAASAAKNLTINFNRKGSFGPTLNAFYLFFNASIQGTATLLTAMARSRKVQALTGAVVAAGIAQDLLWSIMSPPDPDDPEKTLYDSIPEYVKQRNMILWVNDDGSYVSLPMPYGYNFFHNVGRLSTRYARGAPVGAGRPASILDTTRDMMTSFAGAFTPPGFDNILPIPTVAMPIFEVVRNRDFAGRAIKPARSPGDTRPESQMYFPSAPSWSVFAAEKLNQISGGDEYRSGLWDTSPESIQHVVNYFAGATGSFVTRGLGALGATFGEATDTNRQDPDLGWNDIPYVRRVIGEVGDWRGRDIAYQRMADVELLEDEVSGHQEQGDRAGALTLQQQNGPLLALAKEARRLRRALGEIRRTRQALLDGGEDASGARTRIDALDAREKTMLDQFNEKYIRALTRVRVRDAG